MTSDLRIIDQQVLTGERALFGAVNTVVRDCVFRDGESPLKQSRGVRISGSRFEWKYPLWYATDIGLTGSALLDTARSGIWYARDLHITHSSIAAPKTFRRSTGIRLHDVDMPHAQETLWWCEDVDLDRVSAQGDYFGMQSRRVRARSLRLNGNYAFDGASGVTVENSTLISKDAFWNTTDVIVRDSTIVGEYLGWNSRNLTFVNCTIESLQGLCYIDNLRLIDCRVIDTTLAFEYSTVDATVDSHIDSVFNPSGGRIRARSIGELTVDPQRVDPAATRIETPEFSDAL
ncbi:MAG: DUF3737 family protein [Propioniciclava sp.]|uniref:DUF3737 family protein n=1 Tax=Propioniciclava sp. TaxID=2038686 RepID=UPI0039E55619